MNGHHFSKKREGGLNRTGKEAEAQSTLNATYVFQQCHKVIYHNVPKLVDYTGSEEAPAKHITTFVPN